MRPLNREKYYNTVIKVHSSSGLSHHSGKINCFWQYMKIQTWFFSLAVIGLTSSRSSKVLKMPEWNELVLQVFYIGKSISDFTCHINVSSDLLFLPLSKSDPLHELG